MQPITMKDLSFRNSLVARDLFGQHNKNLDRISKALNVTINTRGNELRIEGSKENKNLTEKIITQVYELLKNDFDLNEANLDLAIKIIKKNKTSNIKNIFSTNIYKTVKNKPIFCRNLSQQKYAHAILENDILFAIGPAGTGKTYIAMALAMAEFSKGKIRKIILTRPAVEAGEALGFLPGDLSHKINPYLRPLYDALYDMMDFEKARTLIEQETIEIAPLAFMRGRTLNDAFIILDEAQNTTSRQMKMFLTRIGYNSKTIITGDITQTDLPVDKKSGLIEAKKILTNIKGIKFVYFTKDDVVRHNLVSKIINAYEKKQSHK